MFRRRKHRLEEDEDGPVGGWRRESTTDQLLDVLRDLTEALIYVGTGAVMVSIVIYGPTKTWEFVSQFSSDAAQVVNEKTQNEEGVGLLGPVKPKESGGSSTVGLVIIVFVAVLVVLWGLGILGKLYTDYGGEFDRRTGAKRRLKHFGGKVKSVWKELRGRREKVLPEFTKEFKDLDGDMVKIPSYVKVKGDGVKEFMIFDVERMEEADGGMRFYGPFRTPEKLGMDMKEVASAIKKAESDKEGKIDRIYRFQGKLHAKMDKHKDFELDVTAPNSVDQE